LKIKKSQLIWGVSSVLVIGLMVSGLVRNVNKDGYDFERLGQVPVQSEGRIKPFDSLARQTLLQFRERQSFREDKERMTATQWLAEAIFHPEISHQRASFTIHHPDLVTLLAPNGDWDRKHFSLNEMKPQIAEVMKQAEQAAEVEAQLRSPYQREVIELANNLQTLMMLQSSILLPGMEEAEAFYSQAFEVMDSGRDAFNAHQSGREYDQELFDEFLGMASVLRRLDNPAGVRLIPPPSMKREEKLIDWWTVGSATLKAPPKQPDPVVMAYAEVSSAYRSQQPEKFNAALERLHFEISQRKESEQAKAGHEYWYNQSELFYQSSVLYVLAFLLVIFSWLKWPKILGSSAFSIIFVTFLFHTIALILRVYLSGRPPVTNLYSSAIFVGWGAVGLGLLLEKFFKNGIGSITAASVGFLSLIVAHHLAAEGDTMAMLQAVLDTNFWLATHVVIITLGYAATFLAGFLGIVYILRGFFSAGLDTQTALSLEKMVYGIICFATLFSLVGTLLGGIWADQSWGRFWGWDPKENGALLIVLWCAVILHARWGKMIKARGLMILAVLGNIVTAWSWFGTNMLGVGLHSYGFMEKAFFWLAAFIFFQLMIAAIGMVPQRHWGSFEKASPDALPSK